MYDMYTLIELVESKPCLWDKTNNEYKNKIMRNNAWREICLFFEPGFEGFDDKKKNEILNTITTKWSNTRDYFIKSLKMKSGQAQKKQYIYHKHLLFLLKTVKEDSTISNISSQESDNESRPGTSASLNPSQDSDNESRPGTSATTEPISTPGSSQDDSSASRIRKKRLNPVDVEILKALQNHEPRRDEYKDDDKAFLMSILPTIKRISEHDRLEFRIDVMQLLRKYTNRIRALSFNSASSSVNSPTNEVTQSPPHILQTENLMTATSTSRPRPYASSPTNEVTQSPPHILQTENLMTAPSTSRPRPYASSPTNEVTQSPPHILQTENLMTTPSTSRPPHTSSPPKIENQMTASSISLSELSPVPPVPYYNIDHQYATSITELFEQDLDKN